MTDDDDDDDMTMMSLLTRGDGHDGRDAGLPDSQHRCHAVSAVHRRHRASIERAALVIGDRHRRVPGHRHAVGSASTQTLGLTAVRRRLADQLRYVVELRRRRHTRVRDQRIRAARRRRYTTAIIAHLAKHRLHLFIYLRQRATDMP